MNPRMRNGQGFVTGWLVGTLGGLVGLGGAEFRLPVLVGLFGLDTLEAIILNKAMSLVVVAAALLFRGSVISPRALAGHLDVVLNLLTGSLAGAWWAADHAIKLPRLWLNRIVMVLLVGVSLVMLSDALAGRHEGSAALFEPSLLRFVVGVIAGLGIGMVAALLGVAGGELLIPTIVLLYGLDIKLAGSLSLMVSLPTMIVGLTRYTRAAAFTVLRREQRLMCWMVAGSFLGAALGGLLLGLVPTGLLMTLLAMVLLVAAIKIFQHAH
jgi:uncharacterized protein